MDAKTSWCVLYMKSELQGTPLKNNYLLSALQCFSSKAASKKNVSQRKTKKSILKSKELTLKVSKKMKQKSLSTFFLSNILLTQFPVSLSDFSERYYFPFQYQFQQ